jgi:F1F0 ATPase subunit 2
MSAAIASLVLGLIAGAAFAALHFCLLWAAVRRLPWEPGGVTAFLLLALARVALLLTALAAAVMLEAPAMSLMAALVGFLAVRLAATRRQRRSLAGGAAWR